MKAMNQKSVRLTEQNIDSLITEIKGYLTARNVARKDVLKLSLLLEEALLRLRDRFGREQEVTLRTGMFAGTRVVIRLKGERYDPLAEEDEESILDSVFIQNLLQTEGTPAIYRYRNGCNEIIVTAHREQKKINLPGGAITVAVILAVIAALAARQLPEEAASFLTNDLAVPLLSRLMGLIILITGPLILASVTSGICALDDVATMSSMGLKAIGRFFAVTFVMITFSLLVSFLFFPGLSASSIGMLNVKEIIGMLLELIPQDLFSPLAEGKTIQIIVIAMILGIVVLLLEDKAPVVKQLISELNLIIFKAMELVSKIIPLAVFLSIFKTLMVSNPSDILGVWKVVVATYVSMIIFTVGLVLYVCLRRKINVRRFIRYIMPAAVIGFTTGSGTMSMPREFKDAKNALKIDEKVCNFFIPLSHAMFSPSVVVPLVTAAFYAGSYFEAPISLSQILILYILATQLSIASPKVPGGIMATFTILLGQLGMPVDFVGLLMVSNVFVVNAMTGLAVMIRMTELVEFSHEIQKERVK